MSDLNYAVENFREHRRKYLALEQQAAAAYWDSVGAKGPVIRLVSKQILGHEDEYTRDPRVLAEVKRLTDEH